MLEPGSSGGHNRSRLTQCSGLHQLSSQCRGGLGEPQGKKERLGRAARRGFPINKTHTHSHTLAPALAKASEQCLEPRRKVLPCSLEDPPFPSFPSLPSFFWQPSDSLSGGERRQKRASCCCSCFLCSSERGSCSGPVRARGSGVPSSPALACSASRLRALLLFPPVSPPPSSPPLGFLGLLVLRLASQSVSVTSETSIVYIYMLLLWSKKNPMYRHTHTQSNQTKGSLGENAHRGRLSGGASEIAPFPAPRRVTSRTHPRAVLHAVHLGSRRG